jgi:hypothetical protein
MTASSSSAILYAGYAGDQEVSPNDLCAFFEGLDEYPDHFKGSVILPKI